MLTESGIYCILKQTNQEKHINKRDIKRRMWRLLNGKKPDTARKNA